MNPKNAIGVLALGAGLALISTGAQAHGSHSHFHWKPSFGHSVDKLPTFLTSEVDDTAQDPGAPGTLWLGSGNSAESMIIRTNPFANVELAIKAHLRFGADIPPTYVDGDGIIHVEVPTGPFVPEPGFGPIAVWNFAYSYNVALDSNPYTLDNYDAWLLIDSDPSSATDYIKLRMARLTTTPSGQDSGFGWKLGPTTVIGDDEGTAQVTQNSQNIGFGYAPASYETAGFPEAEFDVIMVIAKKFGPKVNELHVVFDVVDP